MTVSVRVKRKALVEDRDKVQILADLAGYNAFEALGRLVHLWDKCISTKSPTLSIPQVEAFLGVGNAAALVTSELGERVDTGIRVCGATEEIEARNRLSDQRRSAGFASVVARTIDQRAVDDSLTDRQRTANEPFTASLSSSDLFSSGASASSETPGDLKQKKEGKRPMPADFAPTDDDRRLASSLGVDADAELSKCRDYHAAHGKRMSDWRATYRNWIRNAGRYLAERSAGKPATGIRRIERL